MSETTTLPALPGTGVTFGDAVELGLIIADALTSTLEHDTPIEIAAQTLRGAVTIAGAAVESLLAGKSRTEAERQVEDAVVDLLETLKVGAPPEPV